MYDGLCHAITAHKFNQVTSFIAQLRASSRFRLAVSHATARGLSPKTTIRPQSQSGFVHRTIFLSIVVGGHVFRIRESADY
ncbi:hypothetical protein [Paraburkholderia caribensis]|jgi:hypothetical protein|uniref:hypothetical protein n=1 Tax=Paraburkholderia caribensis TaxID=75105 RepID=UPI001CC8012F|nr:hypothetical protein [Paraburkholderia caribensis]